MQRAEKPKQSKSMTYKTTLSEIKNTIACKHVLGCNTCTGKGSITYNGQRMRLRQTRGHGNWTGSSGRWWRMCYWSMYIDPVHLCGGHLGHHRPCRVNIGGCRVFCARKLRILMTKRKWEVTKYFGVLNVFYFENAKQTNEKGQPNVRNAKQNWNKKRVLFAQVDECQWPVDALK